MGNVLNCEGNIHMSIYISCFLVILYSWFGLSTFQYPLVKKMVFFLSSDFKSRLCMHFQISTNLELAWLGLIWLLLQHINAF